ncbi:MAG: cell division protein FtsA [Deltaproteobacteria bacterium]
MLRKYICSLDVGSSKIAACCAELKGNKIADMTFESVPSRGVKFGSIVDSIELVDAIGRLMKQVKARSGLPVKSVVAGISGQDILTKHSRAVIPLAERGSKVITTADVEKVIAQARILGSSIDEEIIHTLPFGFTVDSKTDIANPVGLYGHKLEVDLFLVCARLSAVQTLVHAIGQAGFEAEEVFLSGLASNEVVFGNALRKGTDVLCDMGSDFTELLFFSDGQLRNILTLPSGGADLTSVVADSLDIPCELAEEIKCSQGIVGDFERVKEDQEVLVKKEAGYKPIRRRLLCEILTSKAKSMAQTLKESAGKISELPEINNFIILGRTIQQEGFLELLEQELGISVEYGRIQDPKITIPAGKAKEIQVGRKHLTYITALGLVFLSLYSRQRKASSPLSLHPNPFLRLIGKAKEIYQEYF